MKTTLTLLAAALFASAAAAQGPGAGPALQAPPGMPVMDMSGPPPGSSPNDSIMYHRYGFHPAIKGLFHKKCDGCGLFSRLGHGGKLGGPYQGYVPPPPPPAAQGGTLVFPNHPFVRSPRDFFMQDQ
jgi:hypothetical protein